MSRRALTCGLALLMGGWAALASPAARADADPASDILLGSPVFYPYQPVVSPSLQHELERTLSKLRAKGFNLKVAIIGSAPDLGAVANLFGRPQAYATFLDQEISFNKPQPLLVVMPNGFGVSHAASPSALAGLKIETHRGSDSLAASAIQAVVQIAKALGKPIAASRVSSTGGSSSSGVSPLITFGGPAIVVILAVAGLGLARRRAGARE
jgi:hypothetical protein